MICIRYSGDCTVTPSFCAKRHNLAKKINEGAISIHAASFSSDTAISPDECLTCEVGIEAFNEIGGNIEIKKKVKKRVKKVISVKRHTSPYSFHFQKK